MNKLLLSLIAVLAMSSALAADNSVYAWGPWSEGIKPAAGPVYVAPAPVSAPQVDMREAIELLHQYNDIQYAVAPPAIPGAPQLPGVVICSPSCSPGSGGLGGGSQI